MKKFEIGKEYFDRSACNHDCIFTIKIIKRTEKTVTFERNGKTRRAKLFFDERGEYIIPERYSMAPVFRAENEVQPEEEPSVEEAAAETSCGVEIVQPADVNTVVVMVGQRVERVCGASYPPQGGTVIGFVIFSNRRSRSVIVIPPMCKVPCGTYRRTGRANKRRPPSCGRKFP